VRSAALGGVLGNDIFKAVLGDEVSDALSSGVEGGGERGRSECVGNTINIKGGVDLGGNSTEFRGGGKGSVSAEGSLVSGEGVHVLLGVDESLGSLERISTSTELREDLVGKFELQLESAIYSINRRVNKYRPWRKRWLQRGGWRWMLHREWGHDRPHLPGRH
jgi:hypothetical protein